MEAAGSSETLVPYYYVNNTWHHDPEDHDFDRHGISVIKECT